MSQSYTGNQFQNHMYAANYNVNFILYIYMYFRMKT